MRTIFDFIFIIHTWTKKGNDMITNDLIVTDTREQLLLWNNTARYKLDFGDYSIVGHESLFSIERKSLPDLLQTLTSGHKRFKQELQRASVARYFAIVVDGSYTKMRTKDYPNAWRSRIKGKQVTDIANALRVKYGIQVIFTTGRVESKRVIKDLMDAYLRAVEAGHYEKA